MASRGSLERKCKRARMVKDDTPVSTSRLGQLFAHPQIFPFLLGFLTAVDLQDVACVTRNTRAVVGNSRRWNEEAVRLLHLRYFAACPHHPGALRPWDDAKHANGSCPLCGYWLGVLNQDAARWDAKFALSEPWQVRAYLVRAIRDLSYIHVLYHGPDCRKSPRCQALNGLIPPGWPFDAPFTGLGYWDNKTWVACVPGAPFSAPIKEAIQHPILFVPHLRTLTDLERGTYWVQKREFSSGLYLPAWK